MYSNKGLLHFLTASFTRTYVVSATKYSIHPQIPRKTEKRMSVNHSLKSPIQQNSNSNRSTMTTMTRPTIAVGKLLGLSTRRRILSRSIVLWLANDVIVCPFTCWPDKESHPLCDLPFFGSFGSRSRRLAGSGPSAIRRVCQQQQQQPLRSSVDDPERSRSTWSTLGTGAFDCDPLFGVEVCGKISEEKWKIQTKPAIAKKLAHLSTYGNSWNGACHWWSLWWSRFLRVLNWARIRWIAVCGVRRVKVASPSKWQEKEAINSSTTATKKTVESFPTFARTLEKSVNQSVLSERKKKGRQLVLLYTCDWCDLLTQLVKRMGRLFSFRRTVGSHTQTWSW